MKLLVKGKIYTNKGLLDGSILVQDGRIIRVAKNIREPVDKLLDYSGGRRIVLPGLIDLHVHMRDFELSYKEDFFTGTGAAAMGGFTVVADMPNTRPRVNRPDVLKKREKVAKEKALVDYAFYYGVPDREADLVGGIEDLAMGFKIFMQHEFYTDKRRLTEKVLEFASKREMLVVVHAENPKFFVETEMGLSGLPQAEASAIKDIAKLALSYGFPLHVTHISSAAGMRELLRWRGRVGITVDTCPYYLLLNAKEALTKGAVAKVYPSIKSSKDAEILLRRLKEGKIDAIVSDHAPHPPEEKSDPRSASAGFPGLETTLTLLLTLVNNGVLELRDVVRICATNPAKILKLNEIGSIDKGKIGNFTVVDLHRRATINPKAFVSRGKCSPFEGKKVEGMPVATIVRGEPVMLDGELVATAGWGKNVKTYR